jgi:quercetin 2,3-dioxygenase
MSITKPIQQIFPPPPAHMVGDGFKVHNFFPGGGKISAERMSPFLMLDYGAKTEITPTTKRRGVGSHPHRGFETVTLVYHGKFAHHDSMGNSGVIGPGDVQWMTAASGILHQEYHHEDFARSGGIMQVVQLWVNLPAKQKMASPKYQSLTQAQMGRFNLPDGNGYVEVIAGNYQGISGPASTFTPVQLYNARLKKGASVSLDFPAEHNTAILLLDGKVEINGMAMAAANSLVLFANEGELMTLVAQEESLCLVMSGEPIDEPIASYGPFVMNNQQELMQAVTDFNQGKFGKLED